MNDKYQGDGLYILECRALTSKEAGFDYGFVGHYNSLSEAKRQFVFWSTGGDLADWRVIENATGFVIWEKSTVS